MTTKTTAMLYMWSVKRSQRSLHVLFVFRLIIRNWKLFQLAIQIVVMKVFFTNELSKSYKGTAKCGHIFKKLFFMVLRCLVNTLHENIVTSLHRNAHILTLIVENVLLYEIYCKWILSLNMVEKLLLKDQLKKFANIFREDYICNLFRENVHAT